MQDPKEGTGSTPNGLPEGQDATGTPPDATQAGQPSGEEPVPFTTINREDLTPELQQVFDNMNRDYTQKTQEMANMRQELGRSRSATQVGTLVMNHPELRPIVRRVSQGYSLQQAIGQNFYNQQPPQAPPAAIDPQEDPVGFIKQTVGQEIRAALGEVIPQLSDGLNQMRGFVQTSRANSEFEALCTKYPLARDIGSDTINLVRSQYQTAGGDPISMEEALVFLAKEEPAILGSGTPAVTRTNIPPKKTPGNPPVEPGGSGGEGGGGAPPEKPKGIKALQAKVFKILSDGEMTDDGYMRRLERRAAEDLGD